MIDLVKKEINTKTPISSSTVYGLPAVLIGLPFIAVGGFIVITSLQKIQAEHPTVAHTYHMVLLLVGGFFTLAGLCFFVHGMLSWRQRRAIEKFKSERHYEFWEIDYSWNKSAIVSREQLKVFKQLFTAIGFTIFTMPFSWFVFSSYEKGTMMIKLIFGVFILLIVWIWFDWLYQLLKYLKYGESRLSMNSFPVFLGDKMNMMLESTKSIQGLKQVNLILRCIQEKYEVRGHGKNRRSVVVFYQMYAESQEIQEAHIYQAGNLHLPITFALPPEAVYETCLSGRPARYWELEVKAQTPGIDYQTSFLLPVYGKNGSK